VINVDWFLRKAFHIKNEATRETMSYSNKLIPSLGIYFVAIFFGAIATLLGAVIVRVLIKKKLVQKIAKIIMDKVFFNAIIKKF